MFDPYRQNLCNLRMIIPGLLALGFVGCGGGDGLPRVAVRGKVALNETPVERGIITFQPVDPNKPEPIASAIIEKGEYTIPRYDGPVPGKHRISIYAKAATGRKIPDPENKGQTIDEERDIIPAHYNSQSQLEAHVEPSSSNTFDFALRGEVKRTKR